MTDTSYPNPHPQPQAPPPQGRWRRELTVLETWDTMNPIHVVVWGQTSTSNEKNESSLSSRDWCVPVPWASPNHDDNSNNRFYQTVHMDDKWFFLTLDQMWIYTAPSWVAPRSECVNRIKSWKLWTWQQWHNQEVMTITELDNSIICEIGKWPLVEEQTLALWVNMNQPWGVIVMTPTANWQASSYIKIWLMNTWFLQTATCIVIQQACLTWLQIIMNSNCMQGQNHETSAYQHGTKLRNDPIQPFVIFCFSECWNQTSGNTNKKKTLKVYLLMF